ncbi:hypothetical protein EKL94_16545, partial [Stenotrophomonas maltophilia]
MDQVVIKGFAHGRILRPVEGSAGLAALHLLNATATAKAKAKAGYPWDGGAVSECGDAVNLWWSSIFGHAQREFRPPALHKAQVAQGRWHCAADGGCTSPQ